MKNITKIILVLATIFFSQAFLSAMPVDGEIFAEGGGRDIPSGFEKELSFPTNSRGALKAYALTQVQIGVINVQTKNSGTFQRTFVGNTPEDIVDQIKSYDIEFETTSPEAEEVNIQIYLRGSPEGRTLFSGSKHGIKPEQNSGGWFLPKPHVKLVMQESMPVSIPEGLGDVDQVEIRLRDQYGFATRVIDLAFNNGTVFFPARYAGEFGEIVFIDSKEQEFSYDLGTGEYLVSENFEVEVSVGIENYKEEVLYGGQFNDFWPIALDPNQNGGRGSAPVYRLEVTQTTRFKYSGYVYHQDKAGEISVYTPKAGRLIYLDDNDDPEKIPLINGNVEIELTPGKYMLWIEFEILEVPGYNSGGGKG